MEMNQQILSFISSVYSPIWESLFSVSDTAVKRTNNIGSYHHFIIFCLSYKIYIFYETPSLAPISHSSFRDAILITPCPM